MVRNLSLLAEADSFDLGKWTSQFDQALDRSVEAISAQVEAIDLSGLQNWLNDSVDDMTEGADDAIDMGGDAVSFAANVAEAAARSAPIRFPQEVNSNTYISGRGENGVVSDYNVEVVFQGDWPEALREEFVRAADYLSVIIRGDVANAGSIDDMRITARLEAMDGEGGLLGFAGPTNVRNNGLPSQGEMAFDTADANRLDAQNGFTDVVLHEMMHAIGFGTVWNGQGLTTGSIASGDLRFTGENAIEAYRALFPDIAGRDAGAGRGVPIETDFGQGTAGGHWDEATFRSELMTGFVDQPAQVSGMTVAALEDMGYDTIYDDDNPGAAIPQLDDILLVA